MKLKKREIEMLMIYSLANSMMKKENRKEARKAINEDLNGLLESKELNHDEYNEMHKELDKIDEILS